MSDIGRNANNMESAPGRKGSTGQKVRGATEVIHGIGENIRGRFMDAVDSTTNTGNAHPETHQGRLEVERGMAKLTGGSGAAPPPTERAQTSSSGSNSSIPSNPPHYDPGQESESHQPGRYGSTQLAQEGNVLGPTSGMTAGNAGPESAIAQGPYQHQYSAGGVGAGAPGVDAGRRGTNERDFGQGNAGGTGPAPIHAWRRA